ncbi:methyltransferase, family protein [Mycolicibacterium mageritense DSM 44476 = CIP 104973]|uniref:S-adenosyl-L-methionine-dependent methyltransferase n=1 Tax=Mycolicibacterium mageritense TaxID=53462 RepID=A0AAI8TWT8_MYCME|nr:class I SAM-dependent methyltransferase [Mycolicibacterium mageritense]MCC9180987.1 class I SAM-dependent methyltransferase [Mycolicibacterium mageritense]TXI64074.1 MAG: class I SAM-dependent methyltransferase [Mycolicibacterium mageritense]CDO20416.1 methyltransferase, family protein [Mycolicibacterium mageritense DSM 44476 = CIP 104973]BBX35070.1 putative S-adenosyl-L-methionine-dependent methyltransferase [Mycolicibacterium mageritense]BDY29975.1 Putative S-adenosyl-L-methionine-depende
MARTDGDSWDLASSVGATATLVATGRAIASTDPHGLINDPFAAPLVRAVGIEAFTMMVDGTLNITEIAPDAASRVRANIDEMAVRTKFFDDYFLAATERGIRQAVILASGLDARAYRLPWPAGTVVYEIDQPEVIEFKTRTLAEHGATPTAERRTVPIDLREDWPAALRAAGFDPGLPTAWCAEGLLIYLPPDAQDRLFDNIHELSAPGSAVATEFVPALKDFDPEKARAATAEFSKIGLDLDMPSLIYHGERHSAADYLATKGWQMSGTPRTELFARYGIPVPALDDDDDDPLGEIVYISGSLG